MKTKSVTNQVYCCEVCTYESPNSTMFNTCLVCTKNYCVLNCKSDLYFIYNQNVCRICKDNPMVEELTDKWLKEWREKLPFVKKSYQDISKEALKLDKRFAKDWKENLEKYEEEHRDLTPLVHASQTILFSLYLFQLW